MATTKKPLSLGRKLSFYAIYIVAVVLFFELCFRAFYAMSYKNASIVWAPFHALDRYYPGIIEEMDADVPKDDGVFDILLLGGSVLTPAWGDIENQLNIMLKDSLQMPVKIHNMASAAHTSRDSRLKYDLLHDKNYDLVFVYHAINGTRFNNCPDSVFKDDYSHVDFYNKVNTLATSSLSRWSIMPLMYQTLKTNIFRSYAEDNFLPFHAPTKGSHKDWIKYGTNIKTAGPFKNNYTHMATSALEKNQFILLSSFAYHIPTNYSLEAFEAHELDYAAHKNPVELWGTVETVSTGIDKHNQIIAEIIEQYSSHPYFFSVDMNGELEKSGKFFDDLCHLNQDGSAAFVAHLWPAIKKIAIQFSINQQTNAKKSHEKD